MATTAAPHWRRENHSTVSSWIVADGAQKVIDFMTEVLKAQTLYLILSDDKKSVRHASLKIDDTVVMIHDANKEVPAFPAWLHVYVEDVDKTYELAISKGAVSVLEPWPVSRTLRAIRGGFQRRSSSPSTRTRRLTSNQCNATFLTFSVRKVLFRFAEEKCTRSMAIKSFSLSDFTDDTFWFVNRSHSISSVLAIAFYTQ
jgi:PhnB protein